MLLRLAAALLAAGSAAYAAHNITVPSNATSVAYSGLQNNWGPWDGCPGATYTNVTGQFFDFTFVGTGVYVWGTASLDGGIITFNLDSVPSTFNRYSAPPYRCGVLIFEKGQLANTSHTLTATFTGPSPENSTAKAFLEFQYIQYTQLDPSDTLMTSTGTASATTASAAPTQPASSEVNAGAIGGGIAAGVVGLAVIGFSIWFCVRRDKQEKAATIATRPELDPPRQSFIYSPPVRAAGYGRLSHDGDPGDRRCSMSTAPGAMTTSAPWNPDAQMAASLAPQADSSATHYPPGAAAPSMVPSSSQSPGSSPIRTFSPHISASGYTAQNTGPASGKSDITN